MDIKQIHAKKSLKFITLLLTALMIAGVSAATYNYMYISGSVTIGNAKILWLTGADAPSGTSIAGTTVTLPFQIGNGTQQNFTSCLFLKNRDTSGHTLNVSITTPISTSGFNAAKIFIYGNSTGSWTYVSGGTLDMTTTSSSINNSLIAGGYFRLTFYLDAKTTASGTYNFAVRVDYV
jgi:hypothetical protein